MIITLEDVQKHIASHKLIIDIRTEPELTHGMLPTAKHIPFDDIGEAFSLDSKDFEQKYGFVKPTTDEFVVLYCRTGRRSALATQTLSSLGYNIVNYKGSIWEWSQIDESVKRYF